MPELSLLLKRTSAVFLLLVAVPVVTLVYSWSDYQPEAWDHLLTWVLPETLLNTFYFVVFVCILCLFIGCGLAALVVFYDFPGRDFFRAALILPMALPSYVLGFIYMGLFEYSGPIFTFLRENLQISFWLPIRSLPGLSLVMSLALYPYVYLLCSQGFRSQGLRAMETGRMLGLRPLSLLIRLIVPLSWPWITGGTLIVAMECLADFGTVSVFSYDTLTTAIYKAWYGFFTPSVSGQISSLMLILVVALLFLTSLSDKKRFTALSYEPSGFNRQPLQGGKKWLVTSLLTVFFSFSFVLPVIQLLNWIMGNGLKNFLPEFGLLMKNTLLTGGVGGALCLLGSLVLVLANRLKSYQSHDYWWARLALMGYAVPGNVLAVGIFIPMAYLDSMLPDFPGSGERGVFATSLTGLLLGLTIRFTGVCYAGVSAGMKRMPSELLGAARLLGLNSYRIAGQVCLPLLRPACVTGFILAAVDIMKEMPLTLMLRPTGGDTLAVKIFELTSESEWARASAPAMALILAGLGPVILLIWQEHTHDPLA